MVACTLCPLPVLAKGLCNYHWKMQHYAKPENAGKQESYRHRYLTGEKHRQAVKKNHFRPKARFGNGRRNAKVRGIAWELTFSQWFDLIKDSICSYCKGSLPTMGVGLDRVDNNLGYLPSNVVPCCQACNHLKGKYFTAAETQVMVDALLAYRKSLPLK